MSVPVNLTISEAGTRLRNGSLTSVALTEQALTRSESLNPALGGYTAITREPALAQAAVADAELAAGKDLGPLHGIPLAVKDIIDLAGTPTTANSELHDNDPSWQHRADATVSARLRSAGAVFTGKATTTEFACGIPDPEKRFLLPHNAWDVTRSAAGSSSGTGIIVSAGMALGGLGTDTGGSVRLPSAVSGISGLKVTFGRVPKSGVVPLGYSLDTVGPMARSALDCALLLEVMAGHDPLDPCSATAPVERYSEALTGSVDGVRIGVPRPHFLDNDQLEPEVRAAVLEAVERLTSIGAVAEEFDLPDSDVALEAGHMLMVTEAFAYHRNDFVRRWADYGRGTRASIGRGLFFSAGDVAQAHRFRQHYAQRVAEALSRYDVLVTPTMPNPAEVFAEMSQAKRIARPPYMFTMQWNLVGLPAMSIPCGLSSEGLPLGLQIVGRPHAEASVLRVADALQRVTDWHLRAPDLERITATA